MISALYIIKDHFFFSFFAFLLFILGFGFSYFVERYNIKIFKILPLWFLEKTLRFASPDRPFIKIFIFIFCFNSIAIFLYFLSSILIVFPFIIAFLTGTNIGIITQAETPRIFNDQCQETVNVGIKAVLGLLLVPILEIFSFCVSIGMGMAIAVQMFYSFSFLKFFVLAEPRVFAYITLIVPILFVSAFIETSAIKDLKAK